jgi:hypothetical protein
MLKQQSVSYIRLGKWKTAWKRQWEAPMGASELKEKKKENQ